MSGHDWLSSQRAEAASDRILDAATELFVQHDVSKVGMNEIARAAGCSRATLYRYFDSREALYRSYVDREANRMYEKMIKLISEIEDPRERFLSAVVQCLELVRQSPALAAWFTPDDSPVGATIADQSMNIQSMVAGFLLSLGPQDADTIDRRARWVIRVLTSLLMLPGQDPADERALIEEFVVPLVCPQS